MVLFLVAAGLFLFFGGVVALLSDPPSGKRKLIFFTLFAGIVLMGGAASVSYKERVYRTRRLDAWSSLEAVSEMPPVEIEGKWYKIVLQEISSPDGK